MYKIISLIFLYLAIGILITHLAIYVNIKDMTKEQKQRYLTTEVEDSPGFVFFLIIGWPLSLMILIAKMIYETLILGGWGIDDENR